MPQEAAFCCFRGLVFDMICILYDETENYAEVDLMSRISIEEVKHVAHLARLAITDEEAEMFTEQLDSIISFAEELNEVDTDNVEPTTHVLKMKNVMREDEAGKGLPVEDVMKNAPDHKDGYVRVPSILD